MRMRVNRRTIDIIPESPQDEAYIEEVLGLKAGGDCAKAVRIDIMGLGSLAYITIEKGK